MIQVNATEKSKHTYAQTTLLEYIPKIETITINPIENHINCETAGGILRYIYPFMMYEPIWNNSM